MVRRDMRRCGKSLHRLRSRIAWFSFQTRLTMTRNVGMTNVISCFFVITALTQLDHVRLSVGFQVRGGLLIVGMCKSSINVPRYINQG